MTAPHEPFDCLRCGACCRGGEGWVAVDAADDARVAASAQLRRLVVLLRGGDHVRRTLRTVEDERGARCAALAREGEAVRCTIYEDRPTICREVEVGSPTCLAARRTHGLDDVSAPPSGGC